MTLSLSHLRKAAGLAVCVTAIVAVGLVIVVQTIPLTSDVALAFTLDFLFTVPLLYLFLIRKTSIPAITVVPLSLLMLFLASSYVPDEFQHYVSLYKVYALPLLELGVLAFLVVKTRRARRVYKATGNTTDMYDRLKQAAEEVIPAPRLAAAVLATEAGMFYYALAGFRKSKIKAGFTYHRETGLGAVMGAFMLLIIVEAIAVHFLLMLWSELAANLLTFVSLYSLVYVLAIAGAARHRPHQLTQDGLLVRFGLQETLVPLHQITSLERLRGEVPEGKQVASLGMLSNFNLVLSVAEPQLLLSFYGIRRTYTTLAFWADDPQAVLDAYQKATEQK